MLTNPWSHEDALGWAKGEKWEFLVSLGVVGIRTFHYLIDDSRPRSGGAPPRRPAHAGVISGLVVRARQDQRGDQNQRQRVLRYTETAQWHHSSAIYGFLSLRPAEAVIEILDPQGRYLPEVISVSLPDRGDIRESLRHGERPKKDLHAPAYVDVFLRPSALMAPQPGSTRIWGVVTEKGQTVPGAVLQIETIYGGQPATVTTMSMADGTYMLELPGEISELRNDPSVSEVQRKLRLFAPDSNVLASLRKDFIAALPVGLFRDKKYDTMPERSFNGVLRLDNSIVSSNFPLEFTSDTRENEAGNEEHQQPSILLGGQRRWDIQLLP